MVEQQQADPLLTPAEVAALFRVNPKTVTRWAAPARSRPSALWAGTAASGPPRSGVASNRWTSTLRFTAPIGSRPACCAAPARLRQAGPNYGRPAHHGGPRATPAVRDW